MKNLVLGTSQAFEAFGILGSVMILCQLIKIPDPIAFATGVVLTFAWFMAKKRILQA